MSGLALVFDTTEVSGSRVHVERCPVVVAAKASGSRFRVETVQSAEGPEVRELEARGYSVRVCKCVRAAERLGEVSR